MGTVSADVDRSALRLLFLELASDAHKEPEPYDRQQGVRGQNVSPFLLKRVSELTKGASLKANLALLVNNARVAAMIARYVYRGHKPIV